ncbi:peroxiredoxin-like family protein [Anabaena sp. UHCC 0399]|uniref:peroxiredoxin-like family protein n=1 Tax=Anabaena sp. UHCC 0399 TaxID=3110238 RepID=UPI002B1F44D5|nr:peroxiredoxin-like family protein [Anabaena sp. UHCC 0399]MEA5566726.1 peroxiredoxin-like family protein [Anabaena sp. UHCC 0399]
MKITINLAASLNEICRIHLQNGIISSHAHSLIVKSINELILSGIVKQSLKVGDIVPNFILPNAFGQPIELQNLLASGAVVISFFRGHWCPLCSLELEALQQALPAIQTLGAALIAISPQTPHYTTLTVVKQEITYEVLSDRRNDVARQFGIVFQIPEYLRPVFQEQGHVLPKYNGDESFELPIPATFVVSQGGKVVYAFVDPDYTKRLDPIEIVSILRNISMFNKSD